MVIRCLLHLSLFLFAGFVGSISVYADDKKILEGELNIVQSVEKAKVDDYVEPDVPGLSKMYWAIGKMDIDDDILIDEFLMINECLLYLQHYHNDFEWEKIRAATREHILQNMSEFPTKFEIFSPISLGRYDLEEEVFELAEESKITGLRRLDFARNNLAYKETCVKKGEMYDYPSNMIIILSRPLVLEKFHVKPELAKLYIGDAKRYYDNLPLRLQMGRYERLAFLRLKVRITQYKNTVRATGGNLRAVVFGELDGYEVYADQDKLKPLYIKEVKDKRFRRLRKRNTSKTETETEESTPKKAKQGRLKDRDRSKLEVMH